LGKKYYNSITIKKYKVVLNFFIFLRLQKKAGQQFFPPPLLLMLLDPGSGTDKNNTNFPIVLKSPGFDGGMYDILPDGLA
jgi:hypothetical protein